MDAKTKLSRHAAIINAVQNVMGSHPSTLEGRISLSTKAIQMFEKNVRSMGDNRHSMDSVMDMIESVGAMAAFGTGRGRSKTRSNSEPPRGRSASVASQKSTRSTKSQNAKGKGKNKKRRGRGGGKGNQGSNVNITVNTNASGNGRGNQKQAHQHQNQKHPNANQNQKKGGKKNGGGENGKDGRKFRLFTKDKKEIPLLPPSTMDLKKAKFIPPIDVRQMTDEQKNAYAVDPDNWYEEATDQIKARLNARREAITKTRNENKAKRLREKADKIEQKKFEPRAAKGPKVLAETKWSLSRVGEIRQDQVAMDVKKLLTSFGMPAHIPKSGKLVLLWPYIEQAVHCAKGNLHMPAWLNKLPANDTTNPVPSLHLVLWRMCLLVSVYDAIWDMTEGKSKDKNAAIKAKLDASAAMKEYFFKESTKQAYSNVKKLLGKGYHISFMHEHSHGKNSTSKPQQEYPLKATTPATKINEARAEMEDGESMPMHVSDELNTAAASSAGLVQLRKPF